MSKFDPQIYSQYRIQYPPELFDCLKSTWANFLRDGVVPQVIDLGAGTGISALSFSRVFQRARFRLIEPDLAMRNEILKTLGGIDASIEVDGASAEEFVVSSQANLVLIGSAWHWMNAQKATPRILESLATNGVIFVFEYQFPKAVGDRALEVNEWIRRKFNTDWRPPHQAPRGTLIELTQVLRDSPDLSERRRVVLKKEEMISFSDLLGVIRSQSRFKDTKDDWELELKECFGTESFRSFSYTFEAIVFHKRP